MRHDGCVTDVSFGTQLRELRESAGLTQEELAERAGLSAKAISLLERGARQRPYPHTVSALAVALGLTPDHRAALLRSVRRAGAARDQGLSGPGRPVVDLPVPATSLVGRERELREVLHLVTTDGARLVTLTGTGGVGKTRVATAVVRLGAGSFPGGACFVPLAAVSTPDLVLPAVARSLGLPDAGREAGEKLRAAVHGRRMLIVLDNFEQVMDAATDVAALLETVEGPVVLVTSRAPLRVRGEIDYPVAPLWAPATATPTPAAVGASPAGRLFVERARAVRPAFELTEGNAADVAAICRRLSGLPLALEIVAARIRFLGPRQLLARLDHALRLDGGPDLPERQRTLAHTLDWSRDLLDEQDQLLFARLSVFAGDFGLESAEAVAAVPEREGFDGLGHLVEQSLVLAESPFPGATMRYRLLEPVRQYAAARLREIGEYASTKRRHAEHYLRLAELAGPELQGRDQAAWLNRLSDEHDNLRSALAWCVDEGPAELAARFGWSLRMYWLMRNRREEGRLLLERLMPRRHQLPDQLHARLLNALGVCLYGFRGPLRDVTLDSLALFRRSRDRQGEGYALGMLGFAELELGNLDAAEESLRAAQRISADQGDAWNEANLLNHRAVIPLRRRDHRRAAELADQALRLTHLTGDRLAQQTSLQILGQAAWTAGDHRHAAERFRHSLMVAHDLGDHVNIAYALRGLALSDGTHGRTSRAACLLGAAEIVLEEAGLPVFAWADGDLSHAAEAAVAAGDGAWRAVYEDGRALDLEEAIALGHAAAVAPTSA